MKVLCFKSRCRYWKSVTVVSNKISFSEKNYKYFIDYLYNDHKVKQLHILLPKSSDYVKGYDRQTKWVSFLIEDDDLLEKYNSIWDKASAGRKKEYVEPVYNKEFLNPMVTKLQIFMIKKFRK